MNVNRSELAEIIGKRTMSKDKKNLPAEVAAFLLSEKRTHELDAIMRDVIQYRMDNGIVEATLVTAHPVSNNVVNDAMQLLKDQFPGAASYSLDTEVDASVIGGFKLEAPGRQLDLSLKRKVAALKQLAHG